MDVLNEAAARGVTGPEPDDAARWTAQGLADLAVVVADGDADVVRRWARRVGSAGGALVLLAVTMDRVADRVAVEVVGAAR
ncbi:hypothetical protein DVS28_a1085 [Euzebya pacifica]|uniref:Uncharacterized protein n=1 Tax=Euzebya pacifica TaxID=1608957 RepID=A0A346XU89_9ACTN|nr:hypothetical protein [Euzebya pacifica]AXV05786.1 hypothetical protein DVS28_a1085 [Euzebya pacifica]